MPRAFQQHLVDDPNSRYWTEDGTAVVVDISGFTQLSEQLARKGREGAEQITDAIGGSFESILGKYDVADPAVQPLGKIVHGADIPADLGVSPVEAHGLRAIAYGFSYILGADDQLRLRLTW